MQAVTTDLQGFVKRKKSEISLSYQENTNEKLKAIGENVDVWIRDKKREVYEAFQKPATESGIRDFLQTKLKMCIRDRGSHNIKAKFAGKDQICSLLVQYGKRGGAISLQRYNGDKLKICLLYTSRCV